MGSVRVWTSGRGEREAFVGENSSSFLACMRPEEEEEAQCRSKRHHFVLLFFFFNVNNA